MKYHFYYGAKPEFNKADLENFSGGDYECCDLMKDGKGQPVLILKNTKADCPVWKVMYGFSTVVFSSFDEAKAFCNKHFAK